MSNIVLKNISKKYGKNEVLNNLCLEIPEGKVIGLLGLNGAGKTTLINIIAGIENYSGDITPLKKNDIAYMPCSNIFFHDMRIVDALNFYNDFYSFDKASAEKQLLDMNIKHKQSIGSLSSGQFRFFNFTLTINRKAKLYLLDEPLTNLDIIFREKIVTDLISNFDDNKTFIISSHELNNLEPLFTHITILHNKQSSCLYDVEEVRKKKSLDEFYKEAVEC